jgi:hypothetical protein
MLLKNSVSKAYFTFSTTLQPKRKQLSIEMPRSDKTIVQRDQV